MLKVTYKTSNLFSLKKYGQSNLNCQSYSYPMVSTIRSTLIASIIQLEGLEKAKELFHKVKNSIIYIQCPDTFVKNGNRIKRLSNKSYDMKNENKINRDFLIGNNFGSTMGYRERVHIDKIVFYINQDIPNLELYLKNIDVIGDSESMVYLHSIEQTNLLENVLVKWNGLDNVKLYELYDWYWNKKDLNKQDEQWDNIYLYSPNYKNVSQKINCYIDNLIIPT